MAGLSTRSQSLVLGLTWVLACSDDVPSGDEVVDDESTQGSTDDEAEGSTTTSSTDAESSESSDDVDESDTVDTVPDTESTSEESTSEESTSEESTGETTDESTSEESTGSTSEESSSSESSSSDDGMMDTDTGGDFVCGDGMLHVEEACDDGNDIDGDGCETDCTFTVTIEWVVVRDPMNGIACSGIDRMDLRPDGSLATAGVSRTDINAGNLFVATWDPNNGDILAEHVGNSIVNANGQPPNLDALPDGDLLVSRSIDGIPDIGTVWRFGPDLDIEYTLGANQLGLPMTPYHFQAVLAKPGGGMLVLARSADRIHEISAQGQVLASANPDSIQYDIEWVGNEVWLMGLDLVGNAWVGVIERFSVPGLAPAGLTTWPISMDALSPVEIEARGMHRAAIGPVTHPFVTGNATGVWRFDALGNVTDTATISNFGNQFPQGLSIADDGTVVAAAQDEVFGVSVDGTLLWHVDAAELDPEARFEDALVDEQGRIFVGGWKLIDFDCYEALLARLSW